LPDEHPLYVGRAGIYGQRWANLALQNCDLLIALGTRLALPQRGYVDAEFARAARKVIVEIDPAEMAKVCRSEGNATIK
jgi:acetolactate synthase-1/2/3 large subunit